MGVTGTPLELGRAFSYNNLVF